VQQDEEKKTDDVSENLAIPSEGNVFHEMISGEVPVSYDDTKQNVEAKLYEEKEGECDDVDEIADEEVDQDVMDEEEDIGDEFDVGEEEDVNVEGAEDMSHNFETDEPPRKQRRMFEEEQPEHEEQFQQQPEVFLFFIFIFNKIGN
jgi:hypothetical protein